MAEAISAYRTARTVYYAAAEREDAAFARYFEKIQNGTPTNGAAVSRASNATNYASAEMFNAQSAVYAVGIDPWDIDDMDGVDRTPVGA